MTVIAILTGLCAGTAILGALTLAVLPREVRVVRAGNVAAEPAAILALAASHDGYQRFNPYLTADPDLRIETFGPASGIGSGFRFDGRDGQGTQTVAAVDNARIEYAIDLGAMGKPRQSIVALPAEGGARVTWEMRADLGYNPVARVMGLFMDRMLGSTFEQGIVNLDTALTAS